jgi:hypothetical protein
VERCTDELAENMKAQCWRCLRGGDWNLPSVASLTLSLWKRWRYAHRKCRSFSWLHGITTQKTVLLIKTRASGKKVPCPPAIQCNDTKDEARCWQMLLCSLFLDEMSSAFLLSTGILTKSFPRFGNSFWLAISWDMLVGVCTDGKPSILSCLSELIWRQYRDEFSVAQ